MMGETMPQLDTIFYQVKPPWRQKIWVITRGVVGQWIPTNITGYILLVKGVL